MSYLPRGIDPELLISQVKNTMPYLFDAEIGDMLVNQFTPAAIVRETERKLRKSETQRTQEVLGMSGVLGTRLTHFEYFRLCMASHYLTCGTPVPTDVDNQIRHKLWPAELPLDIALQMALLVFELWV